MLRLLLALAALCTSACSLFNFYGLPPVMPAPRPNASQFPDAGFVILEDIGSLEFRVVNLKDGTMRLVAILDHRRRIKILRESGLSAADVVLPIDGFSTVTRTAARSVSAEGHVSNMSSSDVHFEERTDPDLRAPDVKELQFHIPDAEVNGQVEYRYERIYTDPLLVDPWIFGNAMPVLHSEFNLITTPEAEMDYAYGHGEHFVDAPPKRTKTADGREQLTFVERDLEGFFAEPLMPHPAHVTPWIAVVVRALRAEGGALHLDTWSSVADRVWEDLTQIVVKPVDGTLAERYEIVRNALTPLAVPGLGVHAPVPGDALAAGAPACSRDATSVLMQSLVGAETEAYPALITGPMGTPVAEGLPGYYPFIRAVAAVKVGAKMLNNQTCTGDYLRRSSLCGFTPDSLLYLDPLCKHCAFGILPSELAGGRALLLEPDNPHWVNMPLDPPERHAKQIHFAWVMDQYGALTGNVGAEMRGTPAQKVRHDLYEIDGTPDEAAQRARIIREVLDNDPGILKIRGGKLIDQDKTNRSFGVQAQVESAGAQRGRGRYRISGRDLAGSSIPNTWRGGRRLPAVTPGPYWVETKAEVILPTEYHMHSGEPVKISSPFAEYASGFSLRDGKLLRYSRRFVLKVHTISPDDWPAFTDFFKQVRQVEDDGLILQDATFLPAGETN